MTFTATCIACTVTVVIFGHLNRSFCLLLLTYLLTYLLDRAIAAMPLSNEHATCSMSTYFQRFIVFCVQPSRSRWQLVFFITALLFGSGTMTYVLLGTSRQQQWTSEPSDGDVNAPSVSAHTNENAPLVSDSVSNSCTYGAVSDVVS